MVYTGFLVTTTLAAIASGTDHRPAVPISQ
jgi:hypothetical protein